MPPPPPPPPKGSSANALISRGDAAPGGHASTKHLAGAGPKPAVAPGAKHSQFPTKLDQHKAAAALRNSKQFRQARAELMKDSVAEGSYANIRVRLQPGTEPRNRTHAADDPAPAAKAAATVFAKVVKFQRALQFRTLFGEPPTPAGQPKKEMCELKIRTGTATKPPPKPSPKPLPKPTTPPRKP